MNKSSNVLKKQISILAPKVYLDDFVMWGKKSYQSLYAAINFWIIEMLEDPERERERVRRHKEKSG